jgi:integrase
LKCLNFDFKEICNHNRDGRFATQADRRNIRDLVVNQLHEMGYRLMRGSSLRTKRVDALVAQWKAQPLATGRATGLRASNVTGLEWSQVDLARRLAWVHPDQAKARKAIPVPLNAEAVGIIRRWLGRHMTHVFSYHCRPITQVSTKAWYAALARAGIEDFRWHDLRHTWASWHVQNGTPLYVLQGLGSWESPEMVRAVCAPRGGTSGTVCGPADRAPRGGYRERGSRNEGCRKLRHKSVTGLKNKKA